MNKYDNFLQLADFYNRLGPIMSAICVQKGGLPIENYTGRFFAADLLEFIAAYGEKLEGADQKLKDIVSKFRAEADKVKDLTTPSQKPIYEMTLKEFEKVMNIS